MVVFKKRRDRRTMMITIGENTEKTGRYLVLIPQIALNSAIHENEATHVLIIHRIQMFFSYYDST